MKQLSEIIFTLYVYASILCLLGFGLVLMVLAFIGFFSPQILPWVLWHWYIGVGLVGLGVAIFSAVLEEKSKPLGGGQ